MTAYHIHRDSRRDAHWGEHFSQRSAKSLTNPPEDVVPLGFFKRVRRSGKNLTRFFLSEDDAKLLGAGEASFDSE